MKNELTLNELDTSTAINIPLAKDDFFAIQISKRVEQSYYRTQFFEADTFINPMICSASSLLIIHNRIKKQTTIKNEMEFNDFINHEFLAFETKARQGYYHSDFLAIAKFFLISLLKETLAQVNHTSWNPVETNIRTMSDDEYGQKFFKIIEQLLLDPLLYIDLLELAYVILSLGYKGYFFDKPEQYYQLAKIRNSLYLSIKDIRKKAVTEGHHYQAKSETPLQEKLAIQFDKKNIKRVIIASVLSILLFFIGITHHVLEKYAQDVGKIEKNLF